MSDEDQAKIFYLETRKQSDTSDIEARIIHAHIDGLRAGREQAATKLEMTGQEIMLAIGELQPSELAACKAILQNRAAAIRGGGG